MPKQLIHSFCIRWLENVCVCVYVFFAFAIWVVVKKIMDNVKPKAAKVEHRVLFNEENFHFLFTSWQPSKTESASQSYTQVRLFIYLFVRLFTVDYQSLFSVRCFCLLWFYSTNPRFRCIFLDFSFELNAASKFLYELSAITRSKQCEPLINVGLIRCSPINIHNNHNLCVLSTNLYEFNKTNMQNQWLRKHYYESFFFVIFHRIKLNMKMNDVPKRNISWYVLCCVFSLIRTFSQQ